MVAHPFEDPWTPVAHGNQQRGNHMNEQLDRQSGNAHGETCGEARPRWTRNAIGGGARTHRGITEHGLWAEGRDDRS